MTDWDFHETIPAPNRIELVAKMIQGEGPVPFSNVFLGNRVGDEPVNFDTYAFYFPRADFQYELVSTNSDLDHVRPTREKILAASVNPQSVEEIDRKLDPVYKKIGQTALSMVREITLSTLISANYPLVVLCFGQVVRSGQEAAIMLFPQAMHPQPLLEEFQQVLRDVIDQEKF